MAVGTSAPPPAGGTPHWRRITCQPHHTTFPAACHPPPRPPIESRRGVRGGGLVLWGGTHRPACWCKRQGEHRPPGITAQGTPWCTCAPPSLSLLCEHLATERATALRAGRGCPACARHPQGSTPPEKVRPGRTLHQQPPPDRNLPLRAYSPADSCINLRARNPSYTQEPNWSGEHTCQVAKSSGS